MVPGTLAQLALLAPLATSPASDAAPARSAVALPSVPALVPPFIPLSPTTPLSIVSVGAGQDSTAILYRLVFDQAFRARYAPGRILALMSDTGDEHDDTMEHVPVLKAFCAAHGIEFVHITFDMGFHSGPWAKGLRAMYEAKNTVGSIGFNPTCSDNLKIQVVYRYLAFRIAVDFFGEPEYANRKNSLYLYEAAYGPLNVIIGIAAKEEARIAKTLVRECDECDGSGFSSADLFSEHVSRPISHCTACGGSGYQKPRSKWFAECVRRVYPLVHAGMDRAACQQYILSVGKTVPPPSNCFMCHWKSPYEVLWSWMLDPQRFAVWVAIEDKKLAANAHLNAVLNPKSGRYENKNYGVFKTKRLMDVVRDTLADFEAKGWDWDRTFAFVAEYRMSHGHCVNTGF